VLGTIENLGELVVSTQVVGKQRRVSQVARRRIPRVVRQPLKKRVVRQQCVELGKRAGRSLGEPRTELVPAELPSR
jgi:hypothetical protein